MRKWVKNYQKLLAAWRIARKCSSAEAQRPQAGGERRHFNFFYTQESFKSVFWVRGQTQWSRKWFPRWSKTSAEWAPAAERYRADNCIMRSAELRAIKFCEISSIKQRRWRPFHSKKKNNKMTPLFVIKMWSRCWINRPCFKVNGLRLLQEQKRPALKSVICGRPIDNYYFNLWNYLPKQNKFEPVNEIILNLRISCFKLIYTTFKVRKVRNCCKMFQFDFFNIGVLF